MALDFMEFYVFPKPKVNILPYIMSLELESVLIMEQ